MPPVEHRLHSSRIIGETEFLTTKGNNKIKERHLLRTGQGKTKFSPRQIQNFAARRKKVLGAPREIGREGEQQKERGENLGRQRGSSKASKHGENLRELKLQGW